MSLRLFIFGAFSAMITLGGAYADLPSSHIQNADSLPNVVNLIHLEADKQGVPREFAIKVAKRESGLRCNAFNPKDGTSGLYQLKPATARGIGFKGDTSELRTCNAGLTFGMKHLAICYRLAKGNTNLADACHRGGFRSIAGRVAVNAHLEE